jgi:molecular chaperone GrpE
MMETKSEDTKVNDFLDLEEDSVNTDTSNKSELNDAVDISENMSQESLEEAEKNEDQEFEEIGGDSVSAKQKELEHNINGLRDENKKLANELETLKDRLLRTNAEYENFRKRTAREKEGIYTDACEDVLKNMLPVLDNLERAVTADGSVEDLKKGVEMTIRQFKDALDKLQVEEISTEEGFDPNFHNAVMHMEDENLPKNSVVEVFQKGYKRGGKVLRFSIVKVAN